MLKNILIKCFTLAGREDIVSKISEYDKISDIKDADAKKETQALIEHFNFVINSTFEYYLELEKQNLVSSNSDFQIDYGKLELTPVCIKKVEDENYKSVRYAIKTDYIKVPRANALFYVTYNSVPNCVKDFSDDTSFLSTLTERIVIYATVSQYLATKGKYSESEYFEKKFFEEAFKIKSKKERRLKSTFCL